jgi:hypothetical protein
MLLTRLSELPPADPGVTVELLTNREWTVRELSTGSWWVVTAVDPDLGRLLCACPRSPNLLGCRDIRAVARELRLGGRGRQLGRAA